MARVRFNIGSSMNLVRDITLLMTFLLLVSGCATTPEPAKVVVKGVSFSNGTSSPVTDVRLFVEKTKSFVSCGYIPAGSGCSTTFPLREYQGNPVSISWQQENRSWTTGEFVFELPEPLLPGKPITAIVNIGERGQSRVFLTQ